MIPKHLFIELDLISFVCSNNCHLLFDIRLICCLDIFFLSLLGELSFWLSPSFWADQATGEEPNSICPCKRELDTEQPKDKQSRKQDNA